MNYQPILQAHCQSRSRPSTDQSFVKELAMPTQKKIIFKNSRPFKKIKNTTHNPTRTDKKVNNAMTRKLNTDNGLQRRADRTPAANNVLPQLAVMCKIDAECSYQTFVLVDSGVLRNRQLRQHANRYRQPYTVPRPKIG